MEASGAASRADKYSKYTAQSGESGPGKRYLNFYRQSPPPGETSPGVTLELPDQREPARPAASTSVGTGGRTNGAVAPRVSREDIF